MRSFYHRMLTNPLTQKRPSATSSPDTTWIDADIMRALYAWDNLYIEIGSVLDHHGSKILVEIYTTPREVLMQTILFLDIARSFADIIVGVILLTAAYYGLITFAAVTMVEGIFLILLNWASFLRSLLDSCQINPVRQIYRKWNA